MCMLISGQEKHTEKVEVRKQPAARCMRIADSSADVSAGQVAGKDNLLLHTPYVTDYMYGFHGHRIANSPVADTCSLMLD
jgi:hypothetical protein